jgi:hypothetical protein
MAGLDFGTSTSLLATFNKATGAAKSIDLSGGEHPWIPSIVGYDHDLVLVGVDAGNLPPDRIVRSAKRFITFPWLEEKETVSDGKTSRQVDADGVIRAILEDVVYRARIEYPEISSGQSGLIRMGCPAMWTGSQRERLINIARQANITLETGDLIDEPIAAGIAWLESRIAKSQYVEGKVLVFDMGGGTLDVAVMHAKGGPGEKPIITVEHAAAIAQAGDAVDDLILADSISRWELLPEPFVVTGHENEQDIRGWARNTATLVKIALSGRDRVSLPVPYPNAAVPEISFSRDALEHAMRPQLETAMGLVEQSLRMAQLVEMKKPFSHSTPFAEFAAEVDHVVLVGGMSQVPIVQRTLKEAFPGSSIWVGDVPLGSYAESHTTEIVAWGLAHGESYERVNLHRPGFNFELVWTDEETGAIENVRLYDAFRPLEDSANPLGKAYFWRPSNAGVTLPLQGQGKIVVSTPEGAIVNFTGLQDGNLVKRGAIRFDFGFADPSDIVFRLGRSGQIFVRDGAGREACPLIEKWPSIRSGSAERSLRVVGTCSVEHQDRPFDQDWWND